MRQFVLVAGFMLVSASAWAQCGLDYGGGLLGIIANQAARQQCAQEREAARQQQMWQVYQQQQAQAAAQAQAQAAAAEAQARQRDLDRRAAAQRAERAAVQKAAAERAASAQLAAERATDNHCKEQKFAKVMLHEFDELKMMKLRDEHLIDIEHLTTDAFNPDTNRIVCHGLFVMTSGKPISGSFEMRPNVAGDIIYGWTPDALDEGRAHAQALAERSGSSVETAAETRVVPKSPAPTVKEVKSPVQ